VELSVQGELASSEAAPVWRIMQAGALFIGSPASDRVATTAKVNDKRFYRLYKNAAITADATALAEWVKQNVPAR
jgi:ABC-type branched-subunit amino acid transport system substrate-binding protein